MPLIIDGQAIKAALTVDNFVKSFPQFKESSATLTSQNVTQVGPQQLLYIGQRELAGTSPTDEVISILGSEDATTCHIAVLRHTGSGAAAMIHFDGSSTEQGLQSVIGIVERLTPSMDTGRLEMHLVGGFLDDRRNSHEVSDKVFNALRKSTHDIHLATACITHFNTEYRNSTPFPIIYGVAFDVKSGKLYRASFPEKGPDIALRSARHFTGSHENINIYNPETKLLELGPFNYDRLDNVELFLRLPDQHIRKYLSTSPEQEPASFAACVRESLKQLRDFPNPLHSVFKGGNPRRYSKTKDSGMWTLLV